MRAALLEDLGRAGDLTTDAIVPASARTERADGAPARRGGRPGLRDIAFRLIDPAIEVIVSPRTAAAWRRVT